MAENQDTTEQEFRRIPLTKGMYAIVDAEDFDALRAFNWQSTKNKTNCTFYAKRHTQKVNHRATTVQMHRQIMGVFDPRIEVDHRDGNGLNNRRSNLRVATKSQNQHNKPATKRNTSGFKGVSFDSRRGKWRAAICLMGDKRGLGSFATAELAYAAYIEAAKSLHGEFASW